ncbi:MAG: DegT/DnrJ/EryC1/StrS family aminotransferase [Candidatus Melainabacteria bacterium]|nr:DegT/DnrJ/EryC1/StrS family aminotransferase [Candidatus Melainabacteria bacterium]
MAVSTSSKIPLLNIKAQYAKLQTEIEQAVLEVLRSGHYVLGPQTKAFEKEASQFLAAKHAITCANGSDALYLALLALDIKPGDEVITTPFTFAATAEAIEQVGAKTVFADIDPNTFNIDPQEIEKKITPQTKAVIVVHLYGQAAAMNEIMAIARKHKLKVIEDAAQAFGTKYCYQGDPDVTDVILSPSGRQDPIAPQDDRPVGSIADIGTFSFYPTKNLSAAGDAGMLATNSDELAARLRRIRVHGSDRRYYHDELGVNSRMDEIQAAILRIKLKHIESWNNRRGQIAEIYKQGITRYQCPQCIPESNHIYHQFTIKVTEGRDELKTKLAEQDIASEIYYPLPLHMQKLFEHLGHKPEDFPNSLEAAQTILCLPIFPELTDDEARIVVEALQ